MMMSTEERLIDDDRRLHRGTRGHLASSGYYYRYDDTGNWRGTPAMTGEDMMAADMVVMMMMMEVIPGVEACY